MLLYGLRDMDTSVTPAARIIAECGVTALANAMGDDYYPSKVSEWKRAGRIPAEHIPNVIRGAKKLGKTYTPNDFFDLGDAA
jgi:hypothetical protein